MLTVTSCANEHVAASAAVVLNNNVLNFPGTTNNHDIAIVNTLIVNCLSNGLTP